MLTLATAPPNYTSEPVSFASLATFCSNFFANGHNLHALCNPTALVKYAGYEGPGGYCRLRRCRPPGIYSGSAGGINRTNGVEQREAPQNVQGPVIPLLMPSLSCEPDGFPASGTIPRTNRFPGLLFVGHN
jgi:hypothetical protein